MQNKNKLVYAIIGGMIGALLISGVQAATTLPLTAESLISLTNEKRTQLGLSPLSSQPILTAAAARKAQDILNKDYFAHTTPAGKPFYRWIQEEQYQYRSAGENLAIAFKNPEDIIRAWMNSPAHKDNILDPYYQEIGIAVASGEFEEDTTIVVVQLFGEPLTTPLVSPSPIAGERTVIEARAPVFETELPNPSWVRNIQKGMQVILLVFIAISIIFLITQEISLRQKRPIFKTF